MNPGSFDELSSITKQSSARIYFNRKDISSQGGDYLFAVLNTLSHRKFIDSGQLPAAYSCFLAR